MFQLKIFIISCLIYQALAGGPTSNSDCVTCADVLLNAVTPSIESCNARSETKVFIIIIYNSNKPIANGFCVKPILDFSPDEVNSDINTYSSDQLQFV